MDNAGSVLNLTGHDSPASLTEDCLDELVGTLSQAYSSNISVWPHKCDEGKIANNSQKYFSKTWEKPFSEHLMEIIIRAMD